MCDKNMMAETTWLAGGLARLCGHVGEIRSAGVEACFDEFLVNWLTSEGSSCLVAESLAIIGVGLCVSG